MNANTSCKKNQLDTVGSYNNLLKETASTCGETKCQQLKWSTYLNSYVIRWSFTPQYLTKFDIVAQCFQYKRRHLPIARHYLVQSVNEEMSRNTNIYSNMSQKPTLEEEIQRENDFVSTLRCGVGYTFPQKYRSFMDENYYYEYHYFEDGNGGYENLFIEYNSKVDTYEFYTPFFYRAYVSRGGENFPFFEEVECKCVTYPYNKIYNKITNNYDLQHVEYFSVIHANNAHGMRCILYTNLNGEPQGYDLCEEFPCAEKHKQNITIWFDHVEQRLLCNYEKEYDDY
jgi:hypothetical protein